MPYPIYNFRNVEHGVMTEQLFVGLSDLLGECRFYWFH